MLNKVEYCKFGDEEIQKLKAILGMDYGDVQKDALLKFALEDVCEVVKNYCNTDGVPEGLYNTVIRMAIDLYRNENLGDESAPLGSISSISEGDTSINYRSSANEFKDSLLKDYKTKLNRYRKLAW